MGKDHGHGENFQRDSMGKKNYMAKEKEKKGKKQENKWQQAKIIKMWFSYCSN